MLPRPTPSRLAATRRTTLGAAVGATLAAAVAGCDAGGEAPPAAGTPTPTGATASSEAVADPDAALVEEVLAELTSLVALTGAVAARFPGLATPMGELNRMHEAHRAALGADPVDAPGAPAATGPADRVAALGRVRRREQRAQQRLVDWSVAAQSGALARLLGSMSAAVAQRLAGPALASEPA